MPVVISQNVPECPKCAAAMHKRAQGEHIYYICTDCKSIWQVLGGGQSEVELMVSDILERMQDDGR